MNRKCLISECLTNNEKFLSNLNANSNIISIENYKLKNDFEIKVLQELGVKVIKNKVVNICSCHSNLNILLYQAFQLFTEFSNNDTTQIKDKELQLCKLKPLLKSLK